MNAELNSSVHASEAANGFNIIFGWLLAKHTIDVATLLILPKESDQLNPDFLLFK